MIYAVCNQKGGTGKSTTAAALAQAAAYRGRNVLAVDLDPQGNLTFALNGKTGDRNALALLQGEPPLDQVQHTSQGVDLIPAALELSTVTTYKGSARRLQAALEPLRKRYGLIIIDTPPTAGELQYNALQAAQRLLIPLEAESFSLQSLYQVLTTARMFRGSNPALKPAGVVLTKYHGRSLLSRHFRQTIREKAEALAVPYLGEIPPAVAVGEAQAQQVSLYEYAPKSKPAQAYLAIYEKLEG